MFKRRRVFLGEELCQVVGVRGTMLFEVIGVYK